MILLKFTKLQRLSVLFSVKIFILFVVVNLISGCATLYGNNNHEVAIDSFPHQASVYMDGIYYGKTPTSIILPRVNYSGAVITLIKDGYESQSLQVDTEFQNVGYWNLIVLPLFLVDLGSGNMFKIKSSSTMFNIQLESAATIFSSESYVAESLARTTTHEY